MSQVNHAAKARSDPHSPSHAEPDGRHSSLSVRSLQAFKDNGQGDGGADIPDIPLRSSSRQSSVVDYITGHNAFKKIRTGKPKYPEELDLQRPINPNSIQVPMSPQSMISDNPQDGMGADEDVRHSASRSPSTAPKSVHTRSSPSHQESSASSLIYPSNSGLPALQTRGAAEYDGLEPLAEEEIDPASFDLVVPAHALAKQYSLETQSEQLFSAKHLAVIFEDPILLQRFTNFVYQWRPKSVPVLSYYLEALKALKAINYANAVVAACLTPIEGLDYTATPVDLTLNNTLREKANKAFETLTNEDLPAFITHTYVQTVSLTIKRRIADTLPAQLREMSEGLAEVFCLTDPSRPDNPIVFASEEFHKTTQYGMSYVLGRNCRFLQGPKTNPFSVRRIREKLDEGKEHCETFLNYRRDGSPFMNLLMIAPLYDSRGVVRYHIGAQVDVSGLVKDCAGLESLERLVQLENPEAQYPANGLSSTNGEDKEENTKKDEFRELAEMFSLQELKTVREAGGNMHRVQQEDIHDTEGVANWHKPRILIRDDATIHRRDSDPILHDSATGKSKRPSLTGGKLSGVYEHYLLVRPYPSLRVLFASPSLRVPGMLQSNLMARIGGSDRVREAIAQAFADGHGVTAKVRWISRADPQGRSRWIHCTPLLGSNGAVGVWMVVLVDDEDELARRSARDAPPVEKFIHRTAFAESVDNMSLQSLQSFRIGEGDPSAGGGDRGYRDVQTERARGNAGVKARALAQNGHSQNGGVDSRGPTPSTPNTYRFESL